MRFFKMSLETRLQGLINLYRSRVRSYVLLNSIVTVLFTLLFALFRHHPHTCTDILLVLFIVYPNCGPDISQRYESPLLNISDTFGVGRASVGLDTSPMSNSFVRYPWLDRLANILAFMLTFRFQSERVSSIFIRYGCGAKMKKWRTF
jgi:hypothetical protein